MPQFLVCYDYGMGGLWWRIEAGSEEQITNEFRELTVFASPPSWWTLENESGVRCTYRLGEAISDEALGRLKR